MDPVKRYFLWLILTFATSSLSFGQGELTIRNLEYYYDLSADIQFSSQTIVQDDEVKFFGEITIVEPRTSAENLILQYGFLNDFKSEIIISPDTLVLDSILISRRANKYYLYRSFLNYNQASHLIFKVYNTLTNKDYLYDIAINPSESNYNPEILIASARTGNAITVDYIKISEALRMEKEGIGSRVSAIAYFDPFNIARPPMAPPDENVSKSISIDSTFTISTADTLRLFREGLYFFQNDTSRLTGTAKRIVNPYFPKLVRLEQLINAMTYITSSSEHKEITGSDDPKRSFDSFWIDNAQSSDRAGRSIRNYYRRVREANLLFTSYKEGWKTDMGMIYIIFGKPDEVYRKAKNEEEWIYNRSGQLPAVAFNFFKVNSIFSDQHYVLLRKRSYQTVWFQAVDLWRKGNIEID